MDHCEKGRDKGREKDSDKESGNIVIFTSHGSDRRVLRNLLKRYDFNTLEVSDFEDFIDAIGNVGDVALITDEILLYSKTQVLKEFFKNQPAWSYFPLVILSSRKQDPIHMWKILKKLDYSGQLQILERPVHTAELVSVVRSALVSREHQYRIRDELQRRVEIENSLREESRRKNDFLAILGHELRNPLAVLNTTVELLEKEPPLNRRKRYEKTLKRQTTQLRRLVAELLDTSRISRGEIVLRHEVVELGPQMREALESTRNSMGKKEHRIWLSTPPKPLYVSVDPLRLQQIFINLLKNAVTYTPVGGDIWFSAEVKEERGDETGNVVEISVKDTGRGIAQAEMDTIFEPFMSVKTNVEEGFLDHDGLGIGLSIVKQLTELHGGTVEVISKGEGKGSEFLLCFPLTERKQIQEDIQAPADTISPEDHSCEGPPNRRSVLIVEDNEDFAELLGESLSEEGHRVGIVHTGKEALEKVREEIPDFMVLDVGLSEMDGFALGEELRRSEELRETSLIALSGYSLRVPLSKTPFDHYVVKGSGIDKIFEILST